MKIIDESQRILSTDWYKVPDVPQHASLKGHVSTKVGIVDIFVCAIEHESQYSNALGLWGCLRNKNNNIDRDNPVAFINLCEFEEYTVLHQVFTSPEYIRQTIISEMINFTIQVMDVPLISDTQVTIEGEALHKYMCGKFKTSIIYIPTKERFKIEESGISETSDGNTVILPEEDSIGRFIYSDSNPNGQRFFYLWESPGNFNIVVEDINYQYGVEAHRHKGKYAFPPRYFYDKNSP